MRQQLSKKFSGFKILKTREHSIVAILLPVTIACITGSFVIGKLMRESIYTLNLLRHGVDV